MFLKLFIPRRDAERSAEAENHKTEEPDCGRSPVPSVCLLCDKAHLDPLARISVFYTSYRRS